MSSPSLDLYPFLITRSSSSSSSSSSFKQLIPRSCSSSATTSLYGGSGNGYGSGNDYGSRSITTRRTRSDSMYSRGGYRGRSPIGYLSTDELIGEPVAESIPRSGGGDLAA